MKNERIADLGVREIIQKSLNSDKSLYEKTSNFRPGDIAWHLVFPVLAISIIYGFLAGINAQIPFPKGQAGVFVFSLSYFFNFFLMASISGFLIFVGTRLAGHKNKFSDSLRISIYSVFTGLVINIIPTIILTVVSIFAKSYYYTGSVIAGVFGFFLSLYLVSTGISAVYGVSRAKGALYFASGFCVVGLGTFTIGLILAFALGFFR